MRVVESAVPQSRLRELRCSLLVTSSLSRPHRRGAGLRVVRVASPLSGPDPPHPSRQCILKSPAGPARASSSSSPSGQACLRDAAKADDRSSSPASAPFPARLRPAGKRRRGKRELSESAHILSHTYTDRHNHASTSRSSPAAQQFGSDKLTVCSLQPPTLKRARRTARSALRNTMPTVNYKLRLLGPHTTCVCQKVFTHVATFAAKLAEYSLDSPP